MNGSKVLGTLVLGTLVLSGAPAFASSTSSLGNSNGTTVSGEDLCKKVQCVLTLILEIRAISPSVIIGGSSVLAAVTGDGSGPPMETKEPKRTGGGTKPPKGTKRDVNEIAACRDYVVNGVLIRMCDGVRFDGGTNSLQAALAKID